MHYCYILLVSGLENMRLRDAGSSPFSMYTELGVDLSLPSAECQSAATPFECMFEGAAIREKERTPILTHDPVEYLYGVDAAALDSGIDFSAPLTSDPSLDCSLSELLEDCYTNPTTPQGPMLSAVSLSHCMGSSNLMSPLFNR
jgi:hypothetical protein